MVFLSIYFFPYFNFKSCLVINILTVLSRSYLNSPGTPEKLLPRGVRGSFHARLPYNSPVTVPPLLVYLAAINVMPSSWYGADSSFPLNSCVLASSLVHGREQELGEASTQRLGDKPPQTLQSVRCVL